MGRNEIDPDILALFVLTTISKVQTNQRQFPELILSIKRVMSSFSKLNIQIHFQGEEFEFDFLVCFNLGLHFSAPIILKFRTVIMLHFH